MRTFVFAMLLAFCANLFSIQMSESLKVKEIQLSNGLTVWLNEDHNQPKVFGAVLVKAGAKDCPNTGIAHYFEHMMFKGTDKIGTTDYASEKAVLDSIAIKYDELAACTNEDERKNIQQEINELSIRAAAYAIPNEFDRLISKYGGSQLNAGTSYDFTVYLNEFSPHYMRQWAELNSERLLNPVFRFFQSELETVYEEKNMYNDMMGMQAMEKLTERYFYPHPYAFPVIGSTENLKNPQLSQMRKFFEAYYVASNMGLILSGDFKTEEVIPILESTFSRVRRGEAPKHEKVSLPPFKGKEKVKVKLPVPFMKMMALGFRGVPANHEDQVALNIAMGLLNNENGTGYLDQLSVNRKILAAMSLNQALNETGILAVAIVPKLMFQSYRSAEKLVWKEIDRVKQGDFSDEIFNSLKLEQKRNFESALEDINTRSRVMMTVFSQGKTWEEYMEEVNHVDSITKEDVVRVACKYFGKDYLYATKKTGGYPKNTLSKPGFAPIVPKNTEAVSEYAKGLDTISAQEVLPRYVDFSKDVATVQLTPLVTFYATPNPVNKIFSLKMSYAIGKVECPSLVQLRSYLPFLGTESLSFKDYRNQLQVLGSTLTFDADDKRFVIEVSGFEDKIDETLRLVGDFMQSVRADEKQLKQVVNEEKVSRKSFFESSDDVARALLHQVKFGDKSEYLTKLSLQEVKKLKGKDLLDIFATVKQRQCNLHYCGSKPAQEIVEIVRKNLNLSEIVTQASTVTRALEKYDKPTVFFFNDPKVSQSIVYGYIHGDAMENDIQRSEAKLFTGYFGGDMSSLMFQEIREFRSFAYRVKAEYELPSPAESDKPGCMVTMLSTQSDKTLDALGVLDSLMKDMPEKPERIVAVRQSIFNAVNNSYPSFRELSQKVARWKEDGFSADPNQRLLEDVSSMDMGDVRKFYRSQVHARPVVYVIVGNENAIDMNRLAAFGTIVRLKRKDIYR